jgi:hypothetical protein
MTQNQSKELIELNSELVYRRSAGFFRYGMSAGILAGLVSALFLMSILYLRGAGFWTFFDVTSRGWFGAAESAAGLTDGFSTIAIGLTWLVYALGWGAVYGWLVGQWARPLAARALIGELVALVAWTVMTFFVIPVSNPPLRDLTLSQPLSWFLTFVIYGIFLSLGPVLLHDQNVDEFSEPDPRII